MIRLEDLPLLNAILNSLAFTLLIAGRVMIYRRNVPAHRNCMIAAFVVSILFLASYLTYRFLGQEKRFSGQGFVRTFYLCLLATHVVLAGMVPVLASRTLYLGLTGRWELHRRWARWTFPIWVYVSVTGVLVYLFLFQWYGPMPEAGPP